MSEEDDVLTVAAAATYLGVTESQVRNLLGQQVLEGYKQGRDWVVRADSAQLRKAEHGRVSRRLRVEVLVRDGGKCQDCGITPELKKLHVHHIVERQNGGINSADNLVALCAGCHKLRHGMTGSYKEPKSRSYRIDDEVAEAIQKLPMSLNQFLRKVLSADGAFDSRATAVRLDNQPIADVADMMNRFKHGKDVNVGSKGARMPSVVRRELRPKGDSKR